MFTALAAMVLSAGSAQQPAALAPSPAPAQQKTGVQQATEFTCPLTGEELPCPNCCPLNK